MIIPHKNPKVWGDILDHKSRLLINQISDLQLWAKSSGVGDVIFEKMAAPYYKLLASLYEDDYPLAKAVEDSDLLLYYKGPAVEKSNPRLSLLAGIFHNVRRQVGSVAYALADVSNRSALPKDVDLGLTGFAKGSLYIGFSLPDPNDFNEDNERNILGEEDPLYSATKQAIRSIGIVSRMVNEDAPAEAFIKEFPDSKVRDVALSAVCNLSPSGRAGITEVNLMGREIDSRGSKHLTKETRSAAKSLIDAPTKSTELTYFTGTIREIDLDVRRFEIRYLTESSVEDVRCKYPEQYDQMAKDSLDKRVRVSGKIERTPDGKPRFLEVDHLEPAS